MHETDPIGEEGSEHAQPGSNLENDVFRAKAGHPPYDAQDVLVDQEVLTEIFARYDG